MFVLKKILFYIFIHFPFVHGLDELTVENTFTSEKTLTDEHPSAAEFCPFGQCSSSTLIDENRAILLYPDEVRKRIRCEFRTANGSCTSLPTKPKENDEACIFPSVNQRFSSDQRFLLGYPMIAFWNSIGPDGQVLRTTQRAIDNISMESQPFSTFIHLRHSLSLLTEHTSEKWRSENCVRECLNGIKQWDGLFPVTDVTTGIHYVNNLCAFCHGVTETESWKIRIYCSDSNFLAFDYTNILETLLLEPDTPSSCNVRFKKKGNRDENTFHTDVFNHSCITSPFLSTCSAAIYLDAPKSLTDERQSIMDNCKGGTTLYQYLDRNEVYINPSCLTCSEITNISVVFSGTEDIDVDHSLGNQIVKSPLTIFLDTADLYLVANRRENSMMKTPTVCDKNQEDDCRPLLCPTGLIRDLAGRCMRINSDILLDEDSFVENQYMASVRLRPNDSFSVTHLRTACYNYDSCVSTIRFPNNPIGPIPYKCTLVYIGVISPQDIVEDIIVFLMYSSYLDVPIETNLQDFHELTSNNWMVQLLNKYTELKPSFYEPVEVALLSRPPSTYAIASFVVQNAGDVPHHMLPEPQEVLYKYPGLELLYVDGLFVSETGLQFRPSNAFYITEMNFCNQIFLRQDEFELLGNKKILFYKKEQKYLLLGQFRLDKSSMNSNIEGAFVCVKHTHFVYKRSENSSTVSTDVCLLWMFACINFVLLYLV